MNQKGGNCDALQLEVPVNGVALVIFGFRPHCVANSDNP